MKKGFTLIELLIVVAIIGILAGVGVPMYNGYMVNAKIETTKHNHAVIKSFMSSTLTKCSSGAADIVFPGMHSARHPCPNTSPGNTLTTLTKKAVPYFTHYAGFKNLIDTGGCAVIYFSSKSPKVGCTHMFNNSNTVTIITNISNESGGNVYLSDSITLE